MSHILLYILLLPIGPLAPYFNLNICNLKSFQKLAHPFSFWVLQPLLPFSFCVLKFLLLFMFLQLFRFTSLRKLKRCILGCAHGTRLNLHLVLFHRFLPRIYLS